MGAEAAARAGRPRTWLLIVLGLAVAGLMIVRGWTHFSAEGPAAPSNQARPTRAAPSDEGPLDPSELDVRLEALEAKRPERGEVERDPFRFRPPPPPPPPASAQGPGPMGPVGPPPPPQTPPIPLRLMGFTELPGGLRLANLSDCKGTTWSVREGESVDGQYRVVKIGLESIVIEYINGKGRQTLAVNGCPPR